MSYILDALKKAESERQLGAVPTLHAQTAQPVANKSNPLWLVLIVVLLVAIVALLLLRKPAPVVFAAPETVAAQSAAVLAMPQTAATQTAVSQPAVAAPAVQQADAVTNRGPVASALPVTTAATPQPESRAVAASAFAPAAPAAVRSGAGERAAPAAAPAKSVLSGAASPSANPAASQPASVASAPAPRNGAVDPQDAVDEALPLLAQLPDAIQHEVPPIAVKGYIYSKNPADRVLIIGSNFYHEGDEFSSGVRLEKLLPKAAVFSYKGFRYRVAY